MTGAGDADVPGTLTAGGRHGGKPWLRQPAKIIVAGRQK